ncbi:MAG: bifunctional glutamate N-acetyltransferase/amino-acid acetyltransferase ArgJ [Hyphomonadaceae bacterium]
MRSATGSRGFYAEEDRDDVFLFAFDEGTVTAGVFTRSTTASADVDWCREALAKGQGKARGLVVNSGNSNAFTGKAGVLKNDATLAALMAELDADRTSCFLAATGVIGEPLPDANYVGAIVPELANALGSPDWEACARAFMTTDTYPKGAGTTVELGGHDVRIAGIAKGSGMIAPNMATMLAYVFTDVAITPALLDAVLRDAVEGTLNAITVDGDTSTSDTCMVFATGASGLPVIETEADPRFAGFRLALIEVMRDLAHQIVKDGEGASKFVTVNVLGAVDDVSAKTIACAIANSPLLKAALAASDANWGRVVMAVGKSFEPINLDMLKIWFGDYLVAEGGGRVSDYDEDKASAICADPAINITIDVGMAEGRATVWTCDLTHGYVEINGAYRT